MVNKRIKMETAEACEAEADDPQLEAESPTSNSEAPGLPVLVPVSVRSDLPEFQKVSIERVLVGLDLTWIEFLALFQIDLDSSLYIVKGTGGRQANLTDHVGDYVNSLKRRMKVYPVTIEKITPSSPPRRSSQQMAAASSTPPSPSRAFGKRKIQAPKWNLVNGGVETETSKVDQLEDQSDKASRLSTKNVPSTSELQNQSKNDNSFLLPHPVGRKSSNLKRMSPAVAGSSKQSSTVTNGNSSKNVITLNGKRDEIDLSDDDEAMLPKNSKSGSFGRLPDDFEIKPSVIQFLVTKISNKNMLRIREELLQLKTQDDYFQLTCVAPLAAGLLDQMLCRTHPGGNANP